MNDRNHAAILSLLALAFLAIGCSGTLSNNVLLDEARAEFEEAERDPDIVQLAPVALKEAEESLETGTSLWEARADKVLVDHHAYLSKQRTAIARETARLNASQREISRAEADRQRVLLDVRRSEAIRAEERAERALEEARREREAAAELSRRLNELETRQSDRGLILTLGDVLFDFDRSNLTEGGLRSVTELGNFLNRYPDRSVLIEGFTDSIGSEEYNLNLSRRRANAVRGALLDMGIASDRIRTRGYGQQHAVASNTSEAGRQRNRRVEVVISESDETIPERATR